MAHSPSKKAQAQTPEIDADGLPDLTPKQMKFVEGVLAGLTGSEAYRQAYETGDMLPTTISASAAQLRHDPKVNAWIRAGFIAHLTSGILTKEEHVRELGGIRELAKGQGDLKTAVAAEHLRGKVSGFYVERSEHTIYDPATVLAQIRAIDPAIAARLADRFNLQLPGMSGVSPVGQDVLDLIPASPAGQDE